MKKLINGITVIIILLIVSIPTLVLFSEMTAWQLITETESPNAKYDARVFRYLSDIDRHAPYGNYVTIRPTTISTKWNKGHVVLAAYCKNDVLPKWASDTNLEINCQVENEQEIRTTSTRVFGIDVRITNQ
jgi:hypothetical protein